MASKFHQQAFSFDMDMDIDVTPKKMKAGKCALHKHTHTSSLYLCFAALHISNQNNKRKRVLFERATWRHVAPNSDIGIQKKVFVFSYVVHLCLLKIDLIYIDQVFVSHGESIKKLQFILALLGENFTLEYRADVRMTSFQKYVYGRVFRSTATERKNLFD